MTLGDRLTKSRKYAGWSQIDLASKSGVKQGTISKIERGDQNSTTFISQLARSMNIDPYWLATGKGAMVIDGDPNTTTDIYNELAMLRAENRKLKSTIRKVYLLTGQQQQNSPIVNDRDGYLDIPAFLRKDVEQ